MDDLREQMVAYRALHDLTMRDAAKNAGVAVQTWMYVERGLQSPSRLTRAKIENVVNEKED